MRAYGAAIASRDPELAARIKALLDPAPVEPDAPAPVVASAPLKLCDVLEALRAGSETACRTEHGYSWCGVDVAAVVAQIGADQKEFLRFVGVLQAVGLYVPDARDKSRGRIRMEDMPME